MAGALAEIHAEAFGWALSCCHRDRFLAEEVLHVAYVKVLDGSARFDGRSSFKTFLFGVIRNTALPAHSPSADPEGGPRSTRRRRSTLRVKRWILKNRSRPPTWLC